MIYRLRIAMTDGIFWRGNAVQRVIEIAGSRTLEDLCVVLLESLNFDFDHLYEFRINGTSYEGAPPYAPSGNRCRVKLQSLGLKKDDTFTLVYDFCDEWGFDIRVVDVTNAKGGPAKVMMSLGEVKQYPDEDDLSDWIAAFDEEEYDDDEWDDEPEMIRISWDYQPPDELFEQAYRYKKTRLWNRLSEGQIFAIRFRDGNIGYLSVMGKAGEHCALGIHVGEKSFQSFRRLSFLYPMYYDMDDLDWLGQQDCLQVIFDAKEYMREEEEAAVRAYAKSCGMKLSGKNAYAHFSKFQPNHIPWHPENPKEEQYMIESMEAAIAVSDMLNSKAMKKRDIPEIDPLSDSVPLLTKEENGSFRLSPETLPIGELADITWPEASPIPKAVLKKLRKLPKRGTIECGLQRINQPVQDEPDEAPYLPLGFFMGDAEDEFMLPPLLMVNYESNPDQARDHLVQVLTELGIRPSEIRVRDARTFALMGPIAEQLSVKCVMADELPMLDEAIEDLFRFTRGEKDLGGPFDEFGDPDDDFFPDMVTLAEIILALPDEDVAKMPKEVLMEIREVIENDMLPPELAKKLKKKCGLV